MAKPETGRGLAKGRDSIAESASVRDRVMDVAERLFAVHGVAETSIRTLTAEAGVNVAAVNYYFGSRDELFQQVVSRRLVPLNEARFQLLNRSLGFADANPLPVDDTLNALLKPSIDLCFEHPYFARLASRLRLDTESARWENYRDYQLNKLQPFQDALAAALPHLGPQELEDRFHLLLGAIHQVWSHCPMEVERTPESILRSMITFYAAGLKAPASL